jgi:hypothetical protein
MDGLETEPKLDDINLEDKEREKIILPGQGLDTCIPITLPETLYSSLIILPLCSKIGSSPLHRKIINLSLYFCLGANFVIQGVFLLYVYKIYEDAKQEPPEGVGICGGYEHTDRDLRIFCILVYTAYCFSDVAETLKMACFVYNFPTSKAYEQLQFKETIDEFGDTKIEYASGMPIWYKAYCYINILLPKFAIAAALLTYGTGFVVTTDENENLILNALALGFVLDIDNMAYEFFMTFQMVPCTNDFQK